jgi:hypothetical protein
MKQLTPARQALADALAAHQTHLAAITRAEAAYSVQRAAQWAASSELAAIEEELKRGPTGHHRFVAAFQRGDDIATLAAPDAIQEHLIEAQRNREKLKASADAIALAARELKDGTPTSLRAIEDAARGVIAAECAKQAQELASECNDLVKRLADRGALLVRMVEAVRPNTGGYAPDISPIASPELRQVWQYVQGALYAFQFAEEGPSVRQFKASVKALHADASAPILPR